MNSTHRTALVLCATNLGRVIQASAGQIRVETASTPQEVLDFLFESPIDVDIVILPWVMTEAQYSTARYIRRRYPNKGLAFYDSFANHPLSRHRLDEMGLSRLPLIQEHILLNFFESTMLHLFPNLFQDNYSPTLLEFTEPELPLLEVLQREAASVSLTDQDSLDHALSLILQSFGYTIDLVFPVNRGASVVVAGGKLLSITRYFYMLLVTGEDDGSVTVEAVSRLLLLRGAITSEFLYAAITRSPGSGDWNPARERKWHLEGEALLSLQQWIGEAIDMFTRGLSARHFKVSRPPLDIYTIRDARNIAGWIAKGWREADFPEEGTAGSGMWSLPS